MTKPTARNVDANQVVPREGELLEDFVARFYEAFPRLYATELGRNGQFDELPFVAWDAHYGGNNSGS